MHWGAVWADNAEANALTHPESCPDSLQPELKACAVELVAIHVDIELGNFQQTQGCKGVGKQLSKGLRLGQSDSHILHLNNLIFFKH